MTPESRVRRSILIAKGGIEWAGIYERILIPNLVSAIREAINAAYEECAKVAESYGETESEPIRSAFRLLANRLRAKSQGSGE